MLTGTWPTGVDRALRNKMWGNGDDAVRCRHDSKRPPDVLASAGSACVRRDSDRGSGAGRRPRAKGNPANHRYSVSQNNRSGCPPTVAISSGSIITAVTMPSPSCFKFLLQTPGWVCWFFFVFFGCLYRMSHTPSLTFSSRDRKTEKKPNNPNLSLLLCQRPKRVPMHISLLYQLQSIDDFAFYLVQPAPQAMVAQ